MAGVGLIRKRPTPFLVAFAVGTAAIVVLRTTWPNTNGAMAAAGVAVVAITILGVYYARRGGAPTQQAGDDLYYLGLLFTLASLILALILIFVMGSEGSAAARTNELIGNFGIALVSTVAGIIGRVLLQSGGEAPPAARPEPRRDDATDELRRLQAEAVDEARRARDQARQARDAFSHFARMTLAQAEQTRTHTERLVREFDAHMTQLAEAGLRDAGTAWKDTALALRDQGEQLVSRIDAATENAAARTEAAWQGVTTRAEAASAHAKANVVSIDAEVTAVLERLSALNRILPPLAEALDQTQTRVDRLGRTADEIATGLDARAEAATAKAKANAVAIDAEVAALLDRLTAVNRILPPMAEALGQTQTRFDRLGLTADEVATGLDARAEAASAKARANAQAIDAKIAAMLERFATVNRLLPPLAAALDQTQTHVDRLGRSADDAATGLDARAAEIVAAHNALAHGAQEYSVASIEAYRDAIGKFLNDAHDQLRRTGERWMTVVDEFHGAGHGPKKAGKNAATAADEQTEHLPKEVANRPGLAGRTRQALVDVVKYPTKIVRKA